MSPKNDSKRPIIVVKKKQAHAGHHGGSWKVAYADFVTAMMAFFLVMWILGMDPSTKDSIQGYFNNPVGFKNSFSGGTNPISAGNAPTNLALNRLAMLTHDHQRERFEEARAALHREMESNDELRELIGQVEIIITRDGLRIEMLERGTGETLFAFGSSEPRSVTRGLLRVIGSTLRGLPNDIVIEGHTDAVPYTSEGTGYSNWELSVDRANAARRLLLEGGVAGTRVAEVRGYADRHLRLPSTPDHPANRRVSILLPFVSAARPEVQVLTGPAHAATEAESVAAVRSRAEEE